MLSLFGSFIAGVLTVLAPCVLALLPVIVGGSVTGDTKDKKRPIVIAVSLAISIILFTLLLKATTLLINIPPQAITYFSGGIILALGILTLFPTVYAKIIAKSGIEHRAQSALGKGFQSKRQFVGPAIIGFALGPVFSSCSPVYAYILATILPVNFAEAFAYIISYVIGLSLVLLLIGYYGQTFVSKIKFASDPKGWFQRAMLVMTGYDKKFQTFVSNNTPFHFDQLSAKLIPKSDRKIDDKALFNVEPFDAPEFVGLENWINSKPLTLKELEGKVVMVEFWTYSCINCIRNNPYLEKWHQTYKDQGFVIIGMHAPEFAFEKLPKNVQKAVKDQKLNYPVALDNDFATWNAYKNQSWPASYLIDKDGKVRRVHYGEGKYQESEQAIRELLIESGAKLTDKVATNGSEFVPVTKMETPETYLGTRRASDYVGSPPLARAPVQDFVLPASQDINKWALSGRWEVTTEKIIARGNAKLRFRVAAKEMYVVASSPTPQKIQVFMDGKPISTTRSAGSDISGSMVTVGEAKLYRLVAHPSFDGDSMVELVVPDGVELNVFTFGS